MSYVRNLLARHVTPALWDLRFAQYACFVAGPALLVVALNALGRYEMTRGELISGLLGAINGCLLFIAIGMLLPLADPPRKQ